MPAERGLIVKKKVAEDDGKSLAVQAMTNVSSAMHICQMQAVSDKKTVCIGMLILT